MRVRGGTLVVLASLAFASLAVAKKRTDADLPEKYRKLPFSLMSLSVGSPAHGFQLRAKRLRSNEHLLIKTGSEKKAFGHPALVLMLQRSARQMAREAPGARLLVGDLSSEFGGFLPGHKSHQSGRDADVGFFVVDRDGNPKTLRKFVAFDAKGRARNGSGLRFDDYRNWLLVQMWLRDERAAIQHVFVAAHLRRRLLEFAKARPLFKKYAPAAARLLRQPRNSSPHDDHFHVRIHCPERQIPLCK
ncbi:MAG TPA: penicillin-insensitive murein endopeptidase [Polyangiaceae bacterium]|nr:penicillin-insensitive murein endopeptidase [Polyangiaceae bacterium]